MNPNKPDPDEQPATAEELAQLRCDFMRVTCDYLRVAVEAFGDPATRSAAELLGHLNHLGAILSAISSDGNFLKMQSSDLSG